MSDVKEYKCPACGGTMEFDSHSQKMKCPYCDTEMDLQTLKDYEKQKEKDSQADDISQWQTDAGEKWQEGETDGMCVYTCKSCGGEIVAEETTGASSCPFCGNPVVMTQKFSGTLKPDCVIPFKLDKKAAKEAYFKHIKGRPLLPKVFKKQNHIDEIKGIYVPFWLFDAKVAGDARYEATTSRFWSDDQYDYTETSYYSVERSGKMAFAAVPVDGSSQMPDDLMESIEPFHMKDAVDFETAYLSGYLADRYDVTEEQSVERAHVRIKKSTEDVLRDTVTGYDSVTLQNSNVNISGGSAKYAMYPVWILNTTWKGEKFTFAMNGQTGKMTGNLPIDNGIYARWLLGLTAAFSVAVFVISLLIM